MNKLFTKIATAFVGMAMAIGVGVGLGHSGVRQAKATVGDTVTTANFNSSATYYFQVDFTSDKSSGKTVNVVGNLNFSYDSSSTSVVGKVSGSKATGVQFYILESNTPGKYNIQIADELGYYIAPVGKSVVSSNGTLYLSSTPYDLTMTYESSKSTGKNPGWVIDYVDSETTYHLEVPSSYPTSGLATNSSFGGYSSSQYLPSIVVASESSASQLAAPTPSYSNETRKVTWSPVSNASSYQVRVDANGVEGNYETETSPYDGSFVNGTSYTVYVKAIGNGTSFSDSEPGSVSFTPITFVPVTGITLNKVASTIQMGSTETLTATVSPENATDKSVVWSSNATSVATVSDGTVTAVGPGEATITATTNSGNKSETCTITVPAPKFYEITEVSQLVVGKRYLIGAEEKVIGATQNDNNRAAVSLGDSDANGLYTLAATQQILTLGGESEAYTLYATNGSSKGYLYAASTSANQLKTRAGNDDDKSKWNIVNDGNGFSISSIDESVRGALALNNTIFSCYASSSTYLRIYREYLEAETVALTGLSFVEGSSGDCYVGQQVILTPSYTPANATFKAVNWSTSNSAIATVEGGVITTKAAGSIVITATSTINGEITASYTLTVNAVPVFQAVASQSDLFEGARVALLTSSGIVATAMNSGNYLETKAATEDSGGYKDASAMIFTVRIYNNKFALQFGTKYLYYDGSGNDVSLGTAVLNSSAVGYTWTLDATGLKSNPGRYLRYNSGSPRFACYDNSYAVVKLYKAEDSMIDAESRANTFIYKELHMRDIDITNVTKGTDCKGESGYYKTAKAVWNSNDFADSRSYVLANENASNRLTAWADANGESINETTKLLGSSSSINAFVPIEESTHAATIIIVVSIVGISALGGFLFLKKRKEQ